MSAPNIPNLLSLRGTRGGRAGRGRGRGGLGSSPGPSHDQIIQGTDDDAAGSRFSAVSAGYLNDPFAQFFVDASPGPPPRRLPIINRGTYTRTCALDNLIDSFLSKTGTTTDVVKERQIVSLGAGTDTRSLRIFSGTSNAGLTYHEIDFPITTAKKVRAVQGVPALRNVLSSPTEEGPNSWSCQPRDGGKYWCHGLDLRELVQSDGLVSIKGIRTDVPTLVISECCLCYLEPPDAEGVVRWFSAQIPDLAIVFYEPIKPEDAFGKMMVSNLAARRIRMPTLETYKNVADQKDRLREAGFKRVKAMTIEQIWQAWIPAEEKDRVDHLEGLDEVEEWNLLADHYVVAWGWRGSGFELWDGQADDDR